VITAAKLEDIPRLCELLGELFTQEVDFQPDHPQQAAGLALILNDPARGRIFVDWRDGQLVAMVNLLFVASLSQGGRSVLLEDLIVRPAYRGRGIASALLRHAVHFAREEGAVEITLLTDATNTRAIALYEKMGFQRGLRAPVRKYLTPV
jgi:ribosomal protein S18 acetylase RimI-like enzyme